LSKKYFPHSSKQNTHKQQPKHMRNTPTAKYLDKRIKVVNELPLEDVEQQRGQMTMRNKGEMSS
jgi:hypothetical protein